MYSYACKNCGHAFDIHQSFSDASLTDCPDCHEVGALRKQFNSVGVVFKGSGFYRTDNRSSTSGSTAAKSSGSSDSSSSSGSSGSSSSSTSSASTSGSSSSTSSSSSTD